MARQPSASNAVVSSIESAAALFGVRSYRMNSRTIIVPGVGGRERPMFMGQWRDRYGTQHNKGMGDLLLTPRITITVNVEIPGGAVIPVIVNPVVALWCECKAGTGRLSIDQELFREDVLDAGAFYLLAHDGPDVVIEWFQEMGVRR